MDHSYQFLKGVLNTLTEHIAVIDDKGGIRFVNQSWSAFGQRNQYAGELGWESVNYLEICERAAEQGDEFGTKAARGIRSVINKSRSYFYLEYPCHNKSEEHWFMMRVTPFVNDDRSYYVICHQDITTRKQTELAMKRRSQIDGLTNLANRRYFEEFYNNEWRRCARNNESLSIALLDLDHFKILNDTYGHQTGDDCLRKVANTLNRFSQRSNDLCGRYGGEEFILLLGNSTHQKSLDNLNKIITEIRRLKIPNEKSPVEPWLTISAGLITVTADKNFNEEQVIKQADKLLYKAKQAGRNQVKEVDQSHKS